MARVPGRDRVQYSDESRDEARQEPDPRALPSPPCGEEGPFELPLPSGERAGVRGRAYGPPQAFICGQVLSIQVYVEVGSPLGQPGGAVMLRIGIVMIRVGSRIWNG